jgi:hypothetical protein
VRQILSNAAQVAGIVTLVFVALYATTAISVGSLLQAYVLVLGAVVLFTLAFLTRQPADGESSFERALRKRDEEHEPVRELAQIEREVVLGCGTAFYLHFRLRRTLRDIAAHRLRERRGVELDSGGAVVLDVLGPEGWELLRPDRREPIDPDAPGVPRPELDALVERLERI